jgi:hypothetical protein
MINLVAPLEIVQTSATDDLIDVTHITCHCTDDAVSACGLDVRDATWADDVTDDDTEPPCPLCELAWPDDSPTCPWGCVCEEC